MIIFIQHPGENRGGWLWQEAINLGTPAALRAQGVSITAHNFSILAGELRPIIWNYRLRDKSWAWKTGWTSWGAGAKNSKAIRSQACLSLFLGQKGPIFTPVCIYFFLSYWARFLASLCIRHKILPQNSYMSKLFIKIFNKVYSQFLVLTLSSQETLSDWPR